MSKIISELLIIGGGLAGCEAAWQAAQRGINVHLYVMRPFHKTPVHHTPDLAEIVCSNSFGSTLPDRASGLLKNELQLMGSLLLSCAYDTAIPAGNALAADRQAFSESITKKITTHPRISVIREEIKSIPDKPTIISSGPLTSNALAQSLISLTGHDGLYFYDAISPILFSDSINMNIAYKASRFQTITKGSADYINCPFTEEEYLMFVENIIHAERIQLKDFETNLGLAAGHSEYFESCLPIEVMAKRGRYTMAFGPLRPIGLTNPRTGKRPFAVAQLRQDNLSASLYNMVGFQTNLTYSEQKRVFRLIPGLENAEFARYGQMHRNTYIAAPILLLPTMQFKKRKDIFIAGQLCGIEGYLGNIATGLVAALNATRYLREESLLEFPKSTMTGALIHYVTHSKPKYFQPMKANYGILPEIANLILGKRERANEMSKRAINDLLEFININKINHDVTSRVK